MRMKKGNPKTKKAREREKIIKKEYKNILVHEKMPKQRKSSTLIKFYF